MVFTTLAGAYTAYGLVGLRATTGALLYYGVINSLNALVAIQARLRAAAVCVPLAKLTRWHADPDLLRVAVPQPGAQLI